MWAGLLGLIICVLLSLTSAGGEFSLMFGVGDLSAFGLLRSLLVLGISLELFFQSHQKTSSSLLLVGLLVFFYALNTQLDLQTTLTNVLKEHALEHGWYESRRRVQQSFVMVLGLGGLVVLVLSAIFFRRARPATRRMFPGLFALYGYALIRAAAFHRVEFMSLAPAIFALIETSAVAALITGLFRRDEGESSR